MMLEKFNQNRLIGRTDFAQLGVADDSWELCVK